jgi:hypothetical protein
MGEEGERIEVKTERDVTVIEDLGQKPCVRLDGSSRWWAWLFGKKARPMILGKVLAGMMVSLIGR